MRVAHDDRPSHAATADLFVLVVAVVVAVAFVSVVIVPPAALPDELVPVVDASTASTSKVTR